MPILLINDYRTSLLKNSVNIFKFVTICLKILFLLRGSVIIFTISKKAGRERIKLHTSLQ